MPGFARVVLALGVLAVPVTPAAAQSPPPSPSSAMKPWSGSVSAGLALTGGNTETITTNFAFNLESDRSNRNVVKAEGLNIRSSRDGASIVDRTSFSVRDEYDISTRGYVFGQFQYLRDVFKSVEYLVSPSAGFGYKLADTGTVDASIDLSLGSVVERDTNLPTRVTGGVTLRQQAKQKLSDTATVTQALNALWKTSQFSDALYTFTVGLSASITPRTQVKVDFLDTFKNKPPTLDVKKNDVAFITSFGFKF